MDVVEGTSVDPFFFSIGYLEAAVKWDTAKLFGVCCDLGGDNILDWLNGTQVCAKDGGGGILLCWQTSKGRYFEI